jgi:hypothetical protein
VDDGEAQEEILQSRSAIEGKLGRKIIAFSYPGGRWTPRIREMVLAAGYEYAVTTVEGLNSHMQDACLLKRINLYDELVEDAAARFQPSLLATRLILADVMQRARSLRKSVFGKRSA